MVTGVQTCALPICYPAVISGAGPTVLVLAPLAEQTRFTLENHGWSVLSPGIDTRGAVLNF